MENLVKSEIEINKYGIFNLDDDKYFAIDGLNQSKLKSFDKNPYNKFIEMEATNDMEFGKKMDIFLFHSEEELLKQYKLLDSDSKTTTKFTECITKYELEIIKLMHQNIINSRFGELLFQGMTTQVSLFSYHEGTQQQLKGKLDGLLIDDKNKQISIIDYKTCKNGIGEKYLSLESAISSVFEYDYIFQFLFYKKLIQDVARYNNLDWQEYVFNNIVFMQAKSFPFNVIEININILLEQAKESLQIFGDIEEQINNKIEKLIFEYQNTTEEEAINKLSFIANENQITSVLQDKFFMVNNYFKNLNKYCGF